MINGVGTHLNQAADFLKEAKAMAKFLLLLHKE